MIRRRSKSSKASVARLVAKCHPLWICTPLHICVFIVWIRMHLDLHFQMYMYTYWYVQLWTLVKLEISCQSIRPNWPTWENWGVRSPYYRWWTCQTRSTLPPSCIRVYAYIRAYTYLCMTLYVYVYTYMNLSNVINTVCVLSYAAYLEILWLLRWKVVWKCSGHLGLWFLKCQTKSLID